MDLTGVTFIGDVDWSGFVVGAVVFNGATFAGEANFRGAEFRGEASFQSVTFAKAVSFADAVFEAPAQFQYEDHDSDSERGRHHEVTFGGWADFQRVQFRGGARFGGADFESRARFGGASFGELGRHEDASFEGARFARARTFGPMLVRGTLSLDRASFEGPGVRIAVSARWVSCVRAHFVARTTMEIRFAEVLLDDSEFSEPSIVGGSVERFRVEGAEPLLSDSELGDVIYWRPRIRSIKRANVGNLTLLDCDLRECAFAGANNLNGLRFEPSDLDRATWPRTRRRWIAEERDGGVPSSYLAQIYRALRKGREDNKDEPGAADFYYGEMEMRRRAASGFDRAVLTAYWLVSGYGLRAWRSLAALAATVFLFAWGLQAWGFDPGQRFGKSLLFSAESTTSLFRAPSEPNGATLTDAGHVLQMGLRLLGPLFFGLALLAIRGRVKR